MLKEKKVWDIVDGLQIEITTVIQSKKKEKDNVIASKIIKQEVSTNFYINIIRERNHQKF